MSKIKLSKEFIRNTVKLALNEDLYPSGDITSALIKNNKFYVQAGAGVVADSKPEKEYVETVNKAKALMSAVD